MKIYVKNNESFEEKTELEIEELELISEIRELIGRDSAKSMNCCSLIYKDIIMHNNDKFITYYKVSPNDEIWYGEIEDYLKRDHVIIELFIKQIYSEILFLIMSKSENIFHLKSKIHQITPKILNIWNSKGVEITDDQIIGSIDVINGYYRLIINCTEIDNQTFDECCKSYNEYFVRSYVLQYEWFNMLDGNINYFKDEFLIMINRSIELITLNRVKSILNKRIDTLYMYSQFLFCIEISKGILDYFWQKSRNSLQNGDFRYFLTTAAHIKLNEFINSQLNQSNECEKSMRDILYDAINCLKKFLNQSNNNWQDFLAKFLSNFLYPSDSEICKMINESCVMSSFILVKFHQRQFEYFVSQQTKTIFDAKKSISIQTGIPIERLYCLKYSNEIKPNDDDEYEFDDNYIMEIASRIEEKEKGEHLGSGTFGEVMLLENTKKKESFALKTPIDKNGDVYRDINIQTRISFLNIAVYCGLFHDGKHFCMAMKYIQGKPLSKYLGKELSENDIAKISYSILLQIKMLHDNHILHRDIKPDNILIDTNKNAKIIDFGLSKWTERSTPEEMKLELANKKPGTWFYMAPEIIKSEPYTNKIDIWSFGVSMIQMVTGILFYIKTGVSNTRGACGPSTIFVRPADKFGLKIF